MSAIVNIFDSAFNDNHRTIKVDSGLRIEEVENLDWENTLIYVNGFERKKEYKLRENDVATIRQFPSNQGSSARNAVQVLGWFLMPVTSTVTYFVTGSDKGAILALGDSIDSAIHNALKQDVTDPKEIGQGEQLPTISGAKNRSGANQPIPLLLGMSMYTPITLAQSYTTISGADGEEQTFHALYCLGYKNVDVQSVKLGIYQLSADRKNGTSGELDCTNYEKRTFDVEYNQEFGFLDIFGRTAYGEPLGSNVFDIIMPSLLGNKYDTYDIKSFDVNASAVALKSLGDWGSFVPRPCTVTKSGSHTLRITAEPYTYEEEDEFFPRTISTPAGAYLFMYTINSCIVTVTERLDTNHYPKNDTSARKGYHQQLELQQTGNEVSLYPQKVVQENFGTELMHPSGVQPLIMQPFSAKYPQKIQLEITFQNFAHFANDGTEESTTVDLCVGYSLDGGVTYLPFPPFNSGGGGVNTTDEGTVSDEFGTYRKTRFTGHKNKQIRYTATKEFSFSEVFNIPEGTTKCKNNVIEFKIWRDSIDYSITDSKYQSKCFFSAIRTWCYDYKETLKQYEDSGTQALVIQRPIIEKYRDMTARLGFEIRAGDELKGTLDELNVLMQSRARYCTIEEVNGEKTYTWSGEGQQNPYDSEYTVPTNNPASIALMVMQHEMLGEYAYTDAQIDLVSFGKFYEWCEQTDDELINSNGRKYTVNGVASKQFKLIDLVNQILNCGHGRLVINGNKYGVVYDKPDLQPVMVLNNQNVLEAKNTKNFLDDIDGYSCKFIDSLNDYQEDTQIFVPRDLTDPSSPTYKDPSEYKLESIELPWTTDVKRAYRFCMYLLACRKLRPESWERKLGVDGSLVDIGSIVTVQDDTIVVGIGDGAQITEVNEEDNQIVSIEVDYGFNVTDTEKNYGVTIQHANALNGVNVRTYAVANFESTGTKKVLVFNDPIDSATVIKPAVGDIVSFGIYEKVTTNAICVGKKSNNDGTYVLTLAPYQNDIYESEYGLIPEYDSNVTSPKDAGVEVSDELPPITREDVNGIAQAVAQEGSDTPPSAPTDFTTVFYENYIELKCIPSGDMLSDTVKYYEFEITKGTGETPITFTSGSSTFNYVFDRTNDGYPEQNELGNWTFRVRAVNIYGIESLWNSTATKIFDSYGTWQIPTIRVDKEVVDRTVILTAVYGGSQNVLGKIKTCVRIKRVGNNDPVGDSEHPTFNEMLGITADSDFYTPDFNDPVQTVADEDYEGNYKLSTQTAFESASNKVTHTLPLIGQTYRIFKEGNVFTGTFTKDVEDTAEIPLNPSEGDVIHYTGSNTTVGQTEFYKDGYYLYETTWVQVYSKALIVPTTYVYEVQMMNEAGSSKASNVVTVEAQALCTNIADIVHSHEHYKNLYVEKLSAINANIGLISEGGMGSFEDMLNCWALSDLSAEDSGVLGGVKKGTFRVGGDNEYFRVTPIGNGQYKIELKAGNIELTSAVGNESSLDFTKGTYIYNNERDARLKLTQSGVIAEKLITTAVTPQSGDNPFQKGWYEFANGKWSLTSDISVVSGKTYYSGDWQEMAKVIADSKGNMILTNSDNIPPFGYQVENADVYHIENSAHPEYEESASPSNPQSLSFVGKVEDIRQYNPILDTASSTKCFNGSVVKDISNWIGRVVFFTKSQEVTVGDKGIGISGSSETVPAPLVGYDEAMKETSTIDQTKTVGAYLGLSELQIQTGIFD